VIYYSLNRNSPSVSFREAVVKGIAPDKGLYFPAEIPVLPAEFFKSIGKRSNREIAMQAILPFVGDDLPADELERILQEVLDFPFPLVRIEDRIASLELFHGPTMAFKDVGARFMARCLGYFSRDRQGEITVLVATSGDTGGAVANGFYGVSGVRVVILYPRGKVSEIQERQLTTLGGNIRALEVDGTFDDCQRMVKTAFLDPALNRQITLTSANSINIARWLPQLFYFLFAFREVQAYAQDLVFSVPSGNFGNLCAGMVAHRLGMPVNHFIASTNRNDTVPRFLMSGRYEPKPSYATISNAMDVGDPSNFDRIRHLYHDDYDELVSHLSAFSFSDEATRDAMKKLYTQSGYMADPHGAVGYLGLKKYQESHPNMFGVFLETAHPVKFLDVVAPVIGREPDIPPQIQKVMKGRKEATPIASYEALVSFLKSG